jgi:choice-of-anchor B domain-containing protein
MRKLLFITAVLFVSLSVAQTPDLNITFKSNVPFGTSNSDLSNICGYTDAATGREYALVGWEQGTKVIEITNPIAPITIVNIPGILNIWREIKVNGQYAYITTEGGGGLKIAYLGNLPSATIPIVDWTGPVNGATITNIHALHIDNNKVYIYGATGTGNGGAAIIADISGVHATAPLYIGTYSNPSAPYIHDGYVRNDTLYAGHISNGFMSIAKFNNTTATATILANNVVTPTAFTHNTWLSQNSKYMFTTDENSNSFLGVYDINDPTNPTEIARSQSQNPNSGSIGHNTHIVQKIGGEFAVTSWYKDGVVITDVTRPANPVNVGWYDTFTQGTGGGFDGCWGVYPFFPSGNLVCSDIANGLYVLQPTYVRACYFEGLVIDSLTNAPINNANISIAVTPSSNLTASSKFTGDFTTGYPTSGTYTVTVSKSGYLSQTFTVVLANGIVTSKTVKMKTAQPITASITVLSSNGSTPISNANVVIEGTSGSFNVFTNALGLATLSNFPSGNDQIIAAKWGYVTKCVSSFSFNAANTSTTIVLDKGYYDDFATNNNWTVATTALTGAWVRGVPLGTSANAGADILGDCGDKAFVTGNTGTAVGDDDVDNGSTILRSPKFVLNKSSNSTPYIQFSRWFVNNGGTGAPNDSLAVRLKVNAQTFTLDKATASTAGSGTWLKKTVNVNNYFNNGDSLQLEIYTADLNPGHIVEGGFDGFRGIDSTSLGVSNFEQNIHSISIFPNPNNGKFTIKINSSEEMPIQYTMTDILGRSISAGVFYSDKKTIDLKQEKGIYNIELRDKYKKIIYNDRVVISQ